MSMITKNNPSYTERCSIALSDAIRFAKDHNNEIPEDRMLSFFSGIAVDEEDLRQVTYVLHANGIHLAEESYRLSREERAPQGISFPSPVSAAAAAEKKEEAPAPEKHKILSFTQNPLVRITPASQDEMLSVDDLLAKLHAMIGLDSVKKEVDTCVNIIRISQEREKHGLISPPLSLHLVFSGKPGTGKTTVARIVGRIYKKLGLLSRGHFVEVDRTQLVGQYIGETTQKTNAVIAQAMGGVLFIDEAYALTRDPSGHDFGMEAVDILTKAMEDYRADLAIIVAGYPDLMESFLSANPGLRSRFGIVITFPDYTPDELTAIFRKMCDDSDFIADDACMACARAFFKDRYEHRGEDFANARDVRNYFERARRNQANRLMCSGDLHFTTEDLKTLTADDVKEIKIS
ncbi:MAG TPA: hypothetical protein DGX96_10110 [Lachnospiraceae bacterium]|jgi:stage V sporulation protein K|nr:hypothetical protein [Lachnospiraceae bacterium]